MRITSMSLMGVLACCGMFAGEANANYGRIVSQHVQIMQLQAKQLHVELDNSFVTLREYRVLCRQADRIQCAIEDLDKAICRGSRPAVVERLACNVHEEVEDFSRLWNRCDFSRCRVPNVGYGCRSGRFSGIDIAKRRVNLILADLCERAECVIKEVRVPVQHFGHRGPHWNRHQGGGIHNAPFLGGNPRGQIDPTPRRVDPTPRFQFDNQPPSLGPQLPVHPHQGTNFQPRGARGDDRYRTVNWNGVTLTFKVP